jgi:hypothetical protein
MTDERVREGEPMVRVGDVYRDLDKRVGDRCLMVTQVSPPYAYIAPAYRQEDGAFKVGVPVRGTNSRILIRRLLNPRLFEWVA